MGYDEKLQKRDGGNNLIAQFFDELLDDFRPLLGDEHGTYMQDVQAKAVLDSVYARLGDLTTEQKTEAIRLLLATLEGKVSTAAKQDAAKLVLDSIAGKDFATQATLAAVLAKLSADPSTGAKQDAAKLVLDTISTAVAARASEATLAQVKAELTAVKTELAAVKANQISGDQKVQLSGSNVLETTHQNAVSATGNGTEATVTGYATALFSVSGTFSATITVEGLYEPGSTWRTLNAVNLATKTSATTVTTAGQYQVNIAGLYQIRARVTWTSGTSVTVKSRCVAIPASVTLTGGNVPGRLAGAGIETDYAERSGSLAAKTSETIVDYQGQCDLEMLTIGTNYANMRLLIQPYNSVGVLDSNFRLPDTTGASLLTLNPFNLNYIGGENDFFKQYVYDGGASKYMMAMKRQFVLANGVKIQVQNPDATNPYNAAVVCAISKFHN